MKIYQTKKILYDYCDEFIKILRAMEKEMHNLLKLNEEDLKETLRIVNDDLEKYEYLVSILQRRIMDPIDITRNWNARTEEIETEGVKQLGFNGE